MKQTLVYAPSVTAKVMLSDGGIIDLTDDVVRCSVSREADSHSSAELTLANKNGKYDRLIKPMDRIIISATKNQPWRLFTGYVDTAPYLAVWDGDVTISASCTIKRLQKMYWDSGLLTSQELLTQSLDDKSPDSGIAKSAIEVLTKVARWPSSMIHIAEIPPSFLSFASDVFDSVCVQLGVEGEDARGRLERLFRSSSGSFGVGSSVDGVPLSVPQQYAAKIRELSVQYAVPAAFICAVAKSESSWNPEAINNKNSNGSIDYGLMQINTIHKGSYPDYFPPSERWKDGNYSLEIGVKMLAEKLLKVKQKNPLASIDEQLHSTYARYNGGDGNWDNPVPQKNADTLMGIYRDYQSQLSGQASSAIEDKTAPEGIKKPEPNISSEGIPAYGGSPGSEFLYDLYGRTEEEVRRRLVQIQFVDKSISVHRLAANAFIAVSDAIKRTPEYINGTYKIRSIGTFNWRLVIPSQTSRSWHSWGIAVDINPDTNPQRKPLSYDIPDSWIRAFEENGFGWGGRWKSLPDSMHFQYQGGKHGEYLGGIDGYSGGYASGQGPNAVETIFWAFSNMPKMSPESYVFQGKRSLINDSPVWSDVLSLLNASQRSVSSAPDGSLISWFPDRFGVYDKTNYLVVRDTELMDIDISISDEPLTTHVFVAGTTAPNISLQMPDWVYTTGIVSIEEMFPVLEKFVHISGDKSQYSPENMYMRYGARPLKIDSFGSGTVLNSISNGGIVPFMFALYKWMEKWAEQYSVSAKFTFMPELLPGMRIRFESTGIEMYVESVSHSMDYVSGFTTNARLTCPVSRNDENEGMLKSFAAIDKDNSSVVIERPWIDGSEWEQD